MELKGGVSLQNIFDEIYDSVSLRLSSPCVKNGFRESSGIEKRGRSKFQHVRRMEIGFQFIKRKEVRRRKKFLLRSSCMFAHRFEHFSPVSGILAFMGKIIGHFFFLIFQTFYLRCLGENFSIIRAKNISGSEERSFFRHMHLLRAELVLSAILNTRIDDNKRY